MCEQLLTSGFMNSVKNSFVPVRWNHDILKFVSLRIYFERQQSSNWDSISTTITAYSALVTFLQKNVVICGSYKTIKNDVLPVLCIISPGLCFVFIGLRIYVRYWTKNCRYQLKYIGSLKFTTRVLAINVSIQNMTSRTTLIVQLRQWQFHLQDNKCALR